MEVKCMNEIHYKPIKNHLNVNGFRDGTHFIVWDISNSVNKLTLMEVR